MSRTGCSHPAPSFASPFGRITRSSVSLPLRSSSAFTVSASDRSSASAAPPILSDVDSNALVHSVKIAELARRQNISLASLFDAVGVGQDLDPAAVLSTELEIKYAGYFDRERIQADRIRRMGEFALPEDLDYTGMAS